MRKVDVPRRSGVHRFRLADRIPLVDVLLTQGVEMFFESILNAIFASIIPLLISLVISIFFGGAAAA